MSAFLLDVNVLIALFWPSHEHHGPAQRWFARKARQGWATTPVTQAGFIRIVSNPAFSKDAISPAQAVGFMEANMRHEDHRFWPADESVPQVIAPFAGRLVGHGQITDAYLLGLAARFEGKLATFDRGVAELSADVGGRSPFIELIPSG